MPKKLVPVYLDEEEIGRIDRECKKLGLERSPYLRMLIRNTLFGDG